MTEETWEDRYKRAVAKYAGVPDGIAPSDIKVEVTGENGYCYSSWTAADPNICVWVRYPGGFKDIDGPEEVAKLMASFLTPPSAEATA